MTSSDGVRALCTRCGRTWPAETMSCQSCGNELGGETVLDDVHGLETVQLGPRGASVAASQADTTPEAHAFSSAAPPATGAQTNPRSAFAERTDDEIEHVTGVVARTPGVADSLPKFGSSSDPPTRFLRGVDKHIELPSGSIVDDYEIDAKLGAGAMGVVYSARHVKLGRRVAIKVIAPVMGEDPQALARFEREARALASLHHPNIVDVTAFGALPDGRSYLVMEYLVGETLDERLARGRVPLDEALDTFDQIARALEDAHAQGIVHRDLKPSNTFLVRIPREQRSIVKLLDFGLVKLAVADGVEKTASGVVIGTALYISPEQARGPNVDGRTDVYALGCIAYELVLGRHPFPDVRTPTAAIAAHLTEPPPQPRALWPQIPAALDLLLFSMLAKDPNYRPTLAQVRNVIAGVRSLTPAGRRSMRGSTTPVMGGGLYARLWLAALVAFALFIGIVIGARVLGGHDTNAQKTPPAAAVAPSATASGEPPLTHDPRAAAVVPDTTLDAGVGSESQVTRSVEKPKPRVPRSSTPAAPSTDTGEGALTLDSKPWTTVLVDGERKGRTPLVGLSLPVGRHKITLINTTYSIRESFPVEIRPGKAEKLVKDYSDRPEVQKIDASRTSKPLDK